MTDLCKAEPTLADVMQAATEHKTRGELYDEITSLRTRISNLERERDEARGLVDLLREDLQRFIGNPGACVCEGCGAPIDHDEEPATTADVKGCWGYVSDWDGPSPCYRYRTKEGADRSWPPCAALHAKRIAPQTSGETDG